MGFLQDQDQQMWSILHIRAVSHLSCPIIEHDAGQNRIESRWLDKGKSGTLAGDWWGNYLRGGDSTPSSTTISIVSPMAAAMILIVSMKSYWEPSQKPSRLQALL